MKPPGRVAGAFWGAMSGFTSTLAHAGGPPFVIYMLPHRPDKTTFVATSVVFFLIVNYVKLVPYYFLGQLNVENLSTSLLFAPLAPPQLAKTNSLAITSLICGIAQFMFGPLATIPAVVCGHVARNQIRRTGEQGAGMALAGLILGWIGVGFTVLVVLAAVLLVAAASSGGPAGG